MVAFDMDDYDKYIDVATFVKTYQRNANMLIGSLEEISFKKGYIDKNQLRELTKDTPYRNMLADL